MSKEIEIKTEKLIPTLEKMDSFFDKRALTYDDHMLVDLDLSIFYEEIANCFECKTDNIKVLDLGCGTGLELEMLFERYPNMEVTGVDMSQEMLNILKSKYPTKNLNLICASYFDVQFEGNVYDYVLSTYSLHHFVEEKITSLYKDAYQALKKNGIFMLGDYTVKTMEKQIFYLAENERIRKENNFLDGFYHYDTPFTAETHLELLKVAGFCDVKVIQEWESTSIINARK